MRRKKMKPGAALLAALDKIDEISSRRRFGRLKGRPRKPISASYVETEVRYILDVAAYVFESKMSRILEEAMIEWLLERSSEISGSVSRIRSKSRPVVGVSRKNLWGVLKNSQEFLRRTHFTKSPRSVRDFSPEKAIPVKEFQLPQSSFSRKTVPAFTVEFEVKGSFDVAVRIFKILGYRIVEQAIIGWLLRRHAEIAYGLHHLKTTVYSQVSLIPGEGLPAVFRAMDASLIKSKLEGALQRALKN